MSEQLTNVTKQFIKFRETKSRIKKRQQRELRELSKPELVSLGAEIKAARDVGHKIEEIMIAMGIKNRNFLYEALTAWQDEHGSEPDDVPTPAPEPPTGAYDVSLDQLSPTSFRATLGTEEHTLTVSPHGQITNMPEDWLRDLNPEKKKAVQKIIKYVRELTESDS